MITENSHEPQLTAVDFDPFADGGLDVTVPATESQREVWVAAQMGSDASCAYNESISLVLRGELDVPSLSRALQAVVDRHEALRATFSADGATLCISESVKWELVEEDLSRLPETVRRDRLQAILHNDVETPFDLEHGPLLRATLVKLGEGAHQLVLCAHHIICDGLSWETLLSDLATLYCDPVAALSPAVRFSDYARYLVSDSQREAAILDEQYWLRRFADLPPALDLPTDRPRPRMKSYVADRFDWPMKQESVVGLKQLGAQHGCTFVVALMAAFQAYLYRITGQRDIVLGLMSAGNAASGFDSMVGHSVNLLPIRVTVEGEEAFPELLKAVRREVFDATEHQGFSFGSLVKKLPLSRDPGRVPLVPVTFNVDQAMAPFAMGGVRAEVVLNPRRFENFEISLNAAESPADQVVLECTYNRDLFDAETIERRMAEFESFVDAMIAAPERPVDLLGLLPEKERALLDQWNGTDMDAPLTLLHERVVAQMPDRIAAVCNGDEISYGELECRANQLAHYLVSLGVGPDVVVGLCVERSIDMLVAMVGILKAGGAYLPLDPSYPAERLRYMMDDAQAPVLVTQTRLESLVEVAGVKRVLFDSEAALIAAQPATAPQSSVSPSHLAYVIYTSGSTGRPKGVAVPHASVSNFLNAMARRPGMCADDTVLAVTTLSFDIAVLELWLPLTLGARIVLAPQEVVREGAELMALIERSGATLMQATPSTWQMLLAAGWQGGSQLKALSGGEALSPALAQVLRRCVGSLWNMYGPTETTVWSSCDEIDAAASSITIGRPIDNTRMYVLDRQRQLLPVGVPGELYIGGLGVVRGYLNRPELTSERFVESPFWAGERLYRTGDRVKWRSDGRLEYLERLDDQVKVRGFRIELGEIEAALAAHDCVEQVAVVAREVMPGDVRLAAFLVASGTVPEPSQLRNQLRTTLPEYMVPQHYVVLDSLPLTANGKVDRNALPELEDNASQAAYIAPDTETEARLAAIWQEVLNLKQVGAQDNFFDLGGHSILATRVLARIKQAFGLALPLRRFFDAPVVAAMAQEIDVLLSIKHANGAADGGDDREELEF